MTEALTITNPVTPAHYKKSAASCWRGSHRQKSSTLRRRFLAGSTPTRIITCSNFAQRWSSNLFDPAPFRIR
jgi:hypothetical protein